MRRSIIVLAALLCCARAEAKLHADLVEYKDGAETLEGYLAWDDATGTAKKPGVVVVHDWMGVSDDTKKRVEMLAGLGYVAFAADMYGKGKRPADTSAAGALAGKWKVDRPGMRRRVRAAFDVLAANTHVDRTKIGAMGYCFGGTVALELARSGAPVVGTVIFHGGLDTPTPADAKNIKGKVLALHGADDPHVPPQQVADFEKEMRDAKVDWELVAYGGAVHAFTVKAAGTDNAKGAAYNEKADRRSWVAMQAFWSETFGK